MEKQKSARYPESKLVYMVFNWGSPLGCFTSASLALACCVVVSKNWGNPIPEGALTVMRFAPAVGLYKARQEDLTELIMRQMKTYKKVCDD